MSSGKDFNTSSSPKNIQSLFSAFNGRLEMFVKAVNKRVAR